MKENVNYKRIEKIFKQSKGVITRKDIDERDIPSWFLSDFVKKNNLNKIAPGIYASDEYIIDDYFILQKRYPKYIFSGMSALYLHHLTDRIPQTICVTCPQGYHPTSSPAPSLTVNRITNSDLLNLGIIEIETMFGNKVKVYDKERTICDLIKHRNKYDSEVFMKALKMYIKGETNQIKLFKYARIMKIETKVFEIIEILTNED